MKRIALVLILLFVVSVAYGQDDQGNPNDPNVNERANSCYTGGKLEGKCGDSTLLWEAGWYLIRYQFGQIARENFPTWAIWLLEPEKEKKPIVNPDPDPEPEPDVFKCYIEVAPGAFQGASATVLNGGNADGFEWSAPNKLINYYSFWLIWENGMWSVAYYGDCSPLGIGGPIPDDLIIVTPKS